MKLRLSFLFFLLLGMAAPSAKAQWVTQNFQLKTGWNAVFLHIDVSHVTLDQLFGPGAAVAMPVDEVWRWTPNPTTAQFVTSPKSPTLTDSQWTSWKVTDGGTSLLGRLTANAAYLFHATTNATISLKGRPVLPSYRWTTSGLNFLGFPTSTNAPPSFEDFFAPVPAIRQGEIFRYPGGILGTNNPVKIFALRGTPVTRGEAYWLRAGENFNRYYGPFEVLSGGGGDVSFGSSLSTYGFRIRNVTAAPITVTLNLRASETPPTGQLAITGLPALLIRGDLNKTNLTFDAKKLSTTSSQTWTLAAAGQQGSEAEVVIGLDRASLTGSAGSFYAGLLQLSDSLGQIRVDMGISAQVGSTAGLWVGNASVNQVGEYLVNYDRDTSKSPKIGIDGKYILNGVNTNLGAVASPFPLRLIVHNPSTGTPRLFQRLFFGFNGATNPIVATQESSLANSQLSRSRRISSTHLPWSSANDGWKFDIPLQIGSTLTTALTNAYNEHASNPFLHTYHPDHDNLDATFNTELPRGSESYTLVRQITLKVDAPKTDFSSLVSANSTLSGTYLETIRVVGVARAGNTSDTRRFDVQGSFILNRISDIATLTTP